MLVLSTSWIVGILLARLLPGRTKKTERSPPPLPANPNPTEIQKELNKLKKDIEQTQTDLQRRLKRLRVSLMIAALIFNGAAMSVFLFVSKSISVWTSFQTNLAICAPHISPDERLILQAQFAGMQTSDDYESIQDDLKAIASKAGVRLRNEN